MEELLATEPGGWSGIWAHVLNHDLTAETTARRPPHDPVFDLLEAPRRAVARRLDALWVNLADVPGALGSRRYSADGAIVLEVGRQGGDGSDPYRLEVENEIGNCRRVRSRPDLQIDLEDLGACYLGRARFGALVDSGRVRGATDKVRLADQMFTWHPQPWCPEVF